MITEAILHFYVGYIFSPSLLIEKIKIHAGNDNRPRRLMRGKPCDRKSAKITPTNYLNIGVTGKGAIPNSGIF